MKQDKKISACTLAITALIVLPGTGIVQAADTTVPATQPDETTIIVTEPSVWLPTAESDDVTGTMASKPATPAESYVVDTSDWQCKFCAFEEGYSGEVELGLGNVSESSFKFGEYNGLNEDGAFVIANGKIRYRDTDANFLNISIQDPGLDTRSLSIDGGRQGTYKAFFHYDEISHALSDSVKTPYLGNGSANLTLPSTWVAASTTGGMTDLNSSLQNYDIELQRKRMDLGFIYIQPSNWKYDLKYRREDREGTKRSAGSFFFNAAQLIEPVDYVTDQIDASVSYIGSRWQATLAYYGSFFSNENKSLIWEEAFNPIFTGADTGERALPPDNLFQQLILSAGYQVTDKTRLSGDISVGRMQQDEDFLSATTNTSLSVPALPRNSAEALVNTLHGNIRVVSSINEKLRFNASYNYSDHDNQTPQSLYTWVSTDAFVNTPRTNQPYSFTQQETKVGGDYIVSKSSKISAGIDHDSLERTRQEVDKTNETTIWGKLIIRGMDFMDMTFKVAQAERDVSGYEVVPEIDPPQNPLLTKYNMADRSKSTVGANINAMLSEAINVGVGADYSKDDYSESELGLINANELNLNADVSALLTEESSIYAFVTHEHIESQQSGDASGVWVAENDDTVNAIGIGYKHQLMEDRLDVGIDYVVSQSTGRIHIASGLAEDFPDLVTELSSIRLYADYKLEDNMSLHAAYWYESYDSENWALDNVDPDTVWNVLGFGEVTPSYNISVVTMSFKYKF